MLNLAGREYIMESFTCRSFFPLEGFRGFDSSIILSLRNGILMSIGNFPESPSQRILAGTILAGSLGLISAACASARAAPQRTDYYILSYTMLCYIMLCYVILCYVMFYYAMLYYTIEYPSLASLSKPPLALFFGQTR